MEIVKILLVVIFGVVLHGLESLGDDGPLVFDYYKETCPFVEDIVRRQVENAVLKDPRMAASLLRLHFHDCFVMVHLSFCWLLENVRDYLRVVFSMFLFFVFKIV